MKLLGRYLSYALVVLCYFVFVGGVHAASLGLTGKAKVANTAAYLDFSGYSSNVAVDSISGNFSGYGYLEDLGWVAFGTVDNSLGPVNINISTGAVTGKAKVISTGAYLDFTNYSSNVVATIPAGVFSGNVFSEDVGWLNFADTGVSTNGSFDNTAPSGGSISYTDGYYVRAIRVF